MVQTMEYQMACKRENKMVEKMVEMMVIEMEH